MEDRVLSNLMQKSMMGSFATIANGKKLLIIFTKYSVLDARNSPGYESKEH